MSRWLAPVANMRFNSATAVMPWRSPVMIRVREHKGKLQFGHGCDAVEIRGRDMGTVVGALASIRPRL